MVSSLAGWSIDSARRLARHWYTGRQWEIPTLIRRAAWANPLALTLLGKTAVNSLRLSDIEPQEANRHERPAS
jgi:hypothetical protein